MLDYDIMFHRIVHVLRRQRERDRVGNYTKVFSQTCSETKRSFRGREGKEYSYKRGFPANIVFLNVRTWQQPFV